MNRERFFVHAHALYCFQKMFFNTHPDYTEEKNLARHVSTRNQVNVMANELRLHFKNVLTPLVGQKIVKVTPYKSWTVKAKKELQSIEKWMEEQKFRLSYTITDYRIWVDLDKTYNVSESSVNYVKQEFTICELSNQVVLESCDFDYEKFRIDYTAEEIIETRRQIKDLEGRISQLKSSIRQFSR